MGTFNAFSLAKTAARLLGRLALTLIVFVGAIFAGVSGYQALSSRAAVENERMPAPATTVAVDRVAFSDGYSVQRRFSGQFEAQQSTALAFELNGTITEILVREGDRVEPGDIVARLDRRLFDAERAQIVASLEALETQIELAQLTNERQLSLRDAGHVSAARVDDTSLGLARLQANRAELKAALTAVDVRLSKTELIAPYSGRIGDRDLDLGAVASPGLAVLTVLEDGPTRFRVGIDPSLAEELKLGTTAQIVSGFGTHDAVLAQVTPELDAATRSRVVYFETDVPVPALTTGEILISDRVVERGAWLPLSALRQGPRGTWTVLTVSEDQDAAVIGVEAVEVLHLAAGQVYVRGTLVDGAVYVPDGTHRVVPGEAVSTISSNEG
ncbi:MAG: efflux RND transporter periplasmic adaptor subunit [Pseudomonadota bacterium]